MVVVLNVKRVRPKRIICARLARTEHTQQRTYRSDGQDGRVDGGDSPDLLSLQVSSALKWVSYAG